jgi:hypothetical protein
LCVLTRQTLLDCDDRTRRRRLRRRCGGQPSRAPLGPLRRRPAPAARGGPSPATPTAQPPFRARRAHGKRPHAPTRHRHRRALHGGKSSARGGPPTDGEDRGSLKRQTLRGCDDGTWRRRIRRRCGGQPSARRPRPWPVEPFRRHARRRPRLPPAPPQRHETVPHAPGNPRRKTRNSSCRRTPPEDPRATRPAPASTRSRRRTCRGARS